VQGGTQQGEFGPQEEAELLQQQQQKSARQRAAEEQSHRPSQRHS